MNLDKTIPAVARPFGSKAHLEWRKEQRLFGKLNKPVKIRSKAHSLTCSCTDCRPGDVAKAMVDFTHGCASCMGLGEILVDWKKNVWRPCEKCTNTPPVVNTEPAKTVQEAIAKYPGAFKRKPKARIR